MSEVAISVENLGKQYRIGAAQNGGGRYRYKSLRDALTGALSVPFRAIQGHRSRTVPKKREENTFWALKDVSFEIKRGDAVGIIGRNGAGKSTLLKILSRITEPTTGRIRIHGRVASLLEVGTGFHPELTGRENIFMNGAILGMKREEIQRKFDEIVAFAQVERFLDTPVKHYSSGMYVRLAFAVAAHLEQEILVIDEVLAVGDAGFQEKCLGKMREVSRTGRTVLFVSHNMTAIEGLCDGGILLESGKLQMQGQPSPLIRRYLSQAVSSAGASVSLSGHPNRPRSVKPTMRFLRLTDENRKATTVVPMKGTLRFEIEFESDSPITPVFGLVIKTDAGVHVCGFNNRFLPAPAVPLRAMAGRIGCLVRDIPLMPGKYLVNLYFDDGPSLIDTIPDATSFNVISANVFGTGAIAPTITGAIAWPAEFDFQPSAKRR